MFKRKRLQTAKREALFFICYDNDTNGA